MNRFEKPIIKISMFSQLIGTTDDAVNTNGSIVVQGTSLLDNDASDRIHKITYDTLKFK